MKTTILKQHPKTVLKNVICISALSIITAHSLAGSVPTQTQNRAIQLVQAQYPGASRFEVDAYVSTASHPQIKATLDRSTVIKFTHNGIEKTAVMMGDGEHLLLGSIVKPDPNRAISRSTTHLSMSKINANVNNSLNRIEQDHAKPAAPSALLDMNKYRMKNIDIQPLKNSETKTVTDFYNRIQKTPAVITGKGNKHIFIFTDPNCPNCVNEYKSSIAHESDFTFHWLPVYAVTSKPTIKQLIISQPNNELNAKNLHGLLADSKRPEELEFDITPEIEQNLRESQVLFYHLKNKATPVTFYVNSQGNATLIHGYSTKLLKSILSD